MTDTSKKYDLFLDYETTGLRTPLRLLEVAVCIVDPIGVAPVTRIESWTIDPGVTNVRALMEEHVIEMHEENGLLAEIDSGAGYPLLNVENEIIELVESTVGSDARLHISGSGVVRYDRPKMAHYMPRLNGRILPTQESDVSSLRTITRLSGGHLPYNRYPFTSPKHRAAADVQQSIDQLKFFDKLLNISQDDFERVMNNIEVNNS